MLRVRPSREVDDAARQERHRKGGQQKEMISADAIVSARNLKNAPVTPERKDSGRKMMIVARLDPRSGEKNSRAAQQDRACGWLEAGYAGAARNMLDHDDDIVDQKTDRRGNAAQGHDVEGHPQDRENEDGYSIDSGTTIIATSATRQLRRKPSTTIPAKIKSDPDRLLERGDRGANELSLVVPFLKFDLSAASS